MMIYKRIESLCFKRGITVAQACALAGLHRSTSWAWAHGSKPKKTPVVSMAVILGTSFDYLYYGIDLDSCTASGGTYIRELLDEVIRLDTSQRNLLLSYAKELVRETSD